MSAKDIVRLRAVYYQVGYNIKTSDGRRIAEIRSDGDNRWTHANVPSNQTINFDDYNLLKFLNDLARFGIGIELWACSACIDRQLNQELCDIGAAVTHGYCKKHYRQVMDDMMTLREFVEPNAA